MTPVNEKARSGRLGAGLVPRVTQRGFADLGRDATTIVCNCANTEEFA